MQGAAVHRLLISDANVLIDISVGSLQNVMFRLDYDFGLPDAQLMGPDTITAIINILLPYY